MNSETANSDLEVICATCGEPASAGQHGGNDAAPAAVDPWRSTVTHQFVEFVPGSELPVVYGLPSNPMDPFWRVHRMGGCVVPSYPSKTDAARHSDPSSTGELPPQEGTGETCPQCGDGTLVTKRGRFGPFLGCDRYPECGYLKREGR